MLVDTHCHLDASEFDHDREAVVDHGRAAGVGRVVVPAVSASNFTAVAALARQHDMVRAAFGIHPMYVNAAQEPDLDTLRGVLEAEPHVAVGEIGLDFFADGQVPERQALFFRHQLQLAREFDAPVILHIRRAQDQILKHLRAVRVKGGIAHAFNGSRVQADEFIKLGFKLGFGGAMTYPRALRIRELARTLPLEAIVLETDGPDIPPEWIRGQRNEPAELPRIAQVLAELRGMSIEAVIEATWRNACSALPGLLR